MNLAKRMSNEKVTITNRFQWNRENQSSVCQLFLLLSTQGFRIIFIYRSESVILQGV